MTGQKSADTTRTTTGNDANDTRGHLRAIGGSQSDQWNSVLANQVVQTLWLKHSCPDQLDRQMSAVVAALAGMKPKDELEAMMAAQLIAAHNAVMECYRRAMISEQSLEARSENLNQANRLSRACASLMEALDKHRGKGQQKVTVEHVHVHAGGQAVVGMVSPSHTPGGRGPGHLEEQPHAKLLDRQPQNASVAPLPRSNAHEAAMPVAGNAQRPLQDARRQRNRRTKGK
jgi:hypothetical protein